MFSIKKIDTNIYWITEPQFKEHANMFLFDGGDQQLLVDCGIGIGNIKQFLGTQGFLNIQVYITHAHFDHIGGLRYFKPDEIILSEKVYYAIKNSKMYAVEYLNQKDLSDIDLGKLTKDIRAIATIPFVPYLDSTIVVGNFTFQILYLPGHSNDSYCLYEQQNSLLLSGDLLYNGQRYDALMTSDKKHYLHSLNAIQAMEFKYCLPGHTQILTEENTKKIAQQWSKELEN
jgi:glyoxylase-like metal-dependent hydrolase (beta-lactamase superfamily II)